MTLVDADRREIEREAELHAAFWAVDPARRARRSRHVELRTSMDRDDDGSPVFRARCSCGWTSDPVRAEGTLLSWQRHAESKPVESRE